MLENIVNILINYYPLLIKGWLVTLGLSLITVFFGAIIGFLIYLLRASKVKILNIIGSIYVEVIRGVPLMLQILVIYFLMPSSITKFITAAIAMTINSGAYVSEIIRAGINGVDKGQNEAARSLGLSKRTSLFKVVLPQAIKNILPAIGNEYVTVIKETSLAATFFIGDLMTVQNYIGKESLLYLEAYIVVAIFYFISTFTLSRVIGRFELRLKTSD